MNYSVVDCLGLLVRCSGINTPLYLCVINADHFSILALLMFIISGEKVSAGDWLASVYSVFAHLESH